MCSHISSLQHIQWFLQQAGALMTLEYPSHAGSIRGYPLVGPNSERELPFLLPPRTHRVKVDGRSVVGYSLVGLLSEEQLYSACIQIYSEHGMPAPSLDEQ